MAFLSSGQIVGLDGKRDTGTGWGRYERSVFNGSALRLWDATTTTYQEIWRTQPFVRQAVDFLARQVGRTGLQAFKRLPDGDRVRCRPEDTDQDMANWASWVLNPAPNMTQYDFLSRMMHDLAIFDRFLAVKYRDKFGRIWTIPVPAPQWHPLEDGWTGPSGYELFGSSRVDPDQVLVIRGYGADSLAETDPPMEALRNLLAGDRAAEEHRELFYLRGARPEAVLELPEGQQLSDQALERLRADWSGRYSGTRGSGKTPILENGMTYREVSGPTAKDAQYAEVRALTREEVASAFHIPPTQAGIMDGATYGNVAEQRVSLHTECLGPYYRQIEQNILMSVASDMDPALYADFNEASRMSGTPQEQAQAISTLVGRPVLTAAEGRELLNRGRLPDTDELVTPLNVLIGGQPSPQTPLNGKAFEALAKAFESLAKADGEEAVRVAADEDVRSGLASTLAAHAQRMAESVASTVGAKADSASSVTDVDRWNSELAADLLPAMLAQAGQSGSDVAGLVGSDWEVGAAEGWMTEHAAGVAEGLNTSLLNGFDDAGTDLDQIRSTASSWPIMGIAQGVLAGVAGWAALDAVRGKGASKRWVVMSSNPRASHSSINGSTVPIDGVFGNGARWPGDGAAGVNETAGCTCVMEVIK